MDYSDDEDDPFEVNEKMANYLPEDEDDEGVGSGKTNSCAQADGSNADTESDVDVMSIADADASADADADADADTDTGSGNTRRTGVRCRSFEFEFAAQPHQPRDGAQRDLQRRMGMNMRTSGRMQCLEAFRSDAAQVHGVAQFLRLARAGHKQHRRRRRTQGSLERVLVAVALRRDQDHLRLDLT